MYVMFDLFAICAGILWHLCGKKKNKTPKEDDTKMTR